MSKGMPVNGEVTWDEIGKAIGLSREGARNVYKSALRKLESNPELKQYWVDLTGEEHETKKNSRRPLV